MSDINPRPKADGFGWFRAATPQAPSVRCIEKRTWVSVSGRASGLVPGTEVPSVKSL